MSEELSYNERKIAEFRASGGMIADFGDATTLLLTTTGARTGHRRTVPLMYRAAPEDPDRVYVFGSNGGRDAAPGWLRNATADPEVTVEIGAETVPARLVSSATTKSPQKAKQPMLPTEMSTAIMAGPATAITSW